VWWVQQSNSVVRLPSSVKAPPGIDVIWLPDMSLSTTLEWSTNAKQSAACQSNKQVGQAAKFGEDVDGNRCNLVAKQVPANDFQVKHGWSAQGIKVTNSVVRPPSSAKVPLTSDVIWFEDRSL
jgi:hypothetical protein